MTEGDYTRRMLQTIAAITAAVVLIAALFAARQAITLIYISALIAMGFSPIVRVLERPRRVPRWLAILVIYLVIVVLLVLIALLIIPPLVAQTVALWAKLPTEFNRFQSFLIQHKLMVHRVTLEEAVQNAPTINASLVDTLSATATAVTPPITGPMIGIVSPIAAISAMT